MLNYNDYITDLDKFTTDNIDYEQYKGDKVYYNIYNNSIKEPLHNFWFLIRNVKIISTNNKYIRIALNIKNNDHNKVINIIKNIINFLREKYEHDDILYPWIESDNYPTLMNIFYEENTVIQNENNEKISRESITELKNSSFSTIIELLYCKNKDNKLSFVFTIKLLQIDLKINLSLCNLNKQQIQQKHISLPILQEQPKQTINNAPAKLMLNIGDILAKRNQLRKIESIDDDKEKIKTAGETFLEQKELLKKTTVNPRKSLSEIIYSDEKINEEEPVIIDSITDEEKEKKKKKKKDKKKKKKEEIEE